MAADEQEATLDRFLTRLALTDDSKLESVLSKLLPYAISCLGSPHQSVKQKVMEMLTHINKRMKGQPEIKLPLLDLLRLYQNESSSPMVKSFSLVYMEMYLDRFIKENGVDLAPQLLENISKCSLQHQDILLRMAAKEVEKYASEIMDESCLKNYTFVNNPADRNIFLDFSLQTILYQYQSGSPEGHPPGLSKLQVTRILGKSTLQGESLLNRKIGLLNVAAGLNLPADVIYPLLIVASIDNNDRVSRKAEELLKKKAAGVNIEDPILIGKLFSIFQGTQGNETAADAKVSPASPTLKLKLMTIFSHSVAAANSFPATLHCIFDCIYGNHSFLRLKQSGMEFTIWVFKHARDEQMKPMAPIILSGILKLLDNSSSGDADISARQVRMFSYQAIGQLGNRASELFKNSTDMVMRLFEALKIEPTSLKFTIQEAITSIASAYKDCSLEVMQQLDSLLLHNVSAAEEEARFCCVWWAKNVFEFSHCAGRFICMIGASDERLDIREMALEGLFPPKQDKNVQYPMLCHMLDFIGNQQPGLTAQAKIGEQNLLFQSKTFEAMITFLLILYEKSDKSSLDQRLLLLLGHGMALHGSTTLHFKASSGLLTVAANSSKGFAEFYVGQISWMKQFVGHIDGGTRETFGKLLGIVASELSTSNVIDLLGYLRAILQATQKARFEEIHGAVCATGYILAQCMSGAPTIPIQTIRMMLSSLIDLGNSGNPLLSGAVVESIGHIGLRGQLPLPYDNIEVASGDSVRSLDLGQGKTLLSSIIQLLNDTIASKDSKSVQKAIIAYGHLCYGNPEKILLEEALAALFSLSRTKVEELLFSVGEALCFIWGGLYVTADEILKTTFVSLSAADDMDIKTADQKSTQFPDISDHMRANARDVIMSKIFDDLVYSGRKEDRCAGAVWLVSIITYCGKHPRVQQMLSEIQDAFSHLLGDQNDLTQEMASKGMSILYELGDTVSKNELVKALVNTLSGTTKRKRAMKLTEDSEVFEEGTLGQKPDGGNITTYKELCSLANEMGQPDLIYKFMDLANHQASLNSKRGAAFGFAKIAKQAQDALIPYLPSLVPKLVRYQYDPNKLVQDAMVHIWRSIVPEPKKTVDEYFSAIMDDLLLHAGSRLWRSRESSCLALADILQGRQFEEVEKYLEQMWIVCFRAMDDIKETVRTAGANLSRSLSSLTIRLGDTQLSAATNAKATVNIVLPVLLSKGVMSNIQDVQRVSLDIIMKLAKNAGSSIRPQLPDLVVHMLESLSSLEDQRLNYAELHAEKVGLNSEKLETLRVAIARDSPMWETLDFCLRQVDGHTLELLVPRLIHLVRTGVGLNTRVGLAQFIGLLAQQVGPDLKKHTGILLKVLSTAANEERSPSARRAFVSACASVAKFASPMQTQSLFEDAIALHNTGSSNARMTSALLLRELSQQMSDTFVGYHTLVLPVAFIGSFEDDKAISRIFEEIWEENTSGQSVALQLYASDIAPLLLNGISSTSWGEKKKCAKAISKLAEVAGDAMIPFVQPLIKSLLSELSSRFWEGKELLLEAVNAICKSSPVAIPIIFASDALTTGEIVSSLLVACSKKNITFRNTAFSCLEQILLQFKDEKFFKDALNFLLKAFLTSSKTSVAPDGEDIVDDNYFASLEKIMGCIKSCILIASTSELADEFESILSCLLEKINGSYSWQVTQATISTIQALFNRVTEDEVKQNNRLALCREKSAEPAILSILECLNTAKVGQVRVSCLECVLAILQSTRVNNAFCESLRDRIRILFDSEKNSSTNSYFQSVLDMIGSIETDKANA